MKIGYTTSATATGGGRQGHSKTDDGKIDVELTVPKELGGPGGAGTNPEQLFATGYAGCFLGALKFVAGKEKVTLPEDTTVKANVGIGQRDDGQGFGLDVSLTVHAPGIERSTIEGLVERAHVVCPYSHATKGNLDVRLEVA